MKPLRIPFLLCWVGMSLLMGCRKVEITTTNDVGDELPLCVHAYIRNHHEEPNPNPWARVWRWEANGQTYYYLISDCCDQFNLLYDEACNLVCAPDGGITGAGDGQCPVWSTEPVKTLVWQDQ